ncbi:MAG: DUF4080 domain-containing protein [Desulfobulbaceae bacterium]|nr:DUF4080 domain-containing protein [Desulfobulbaceae bacterium]
MKCALVGFNCRYTHSTLSLFYLRKALEKNSPFTDISLYQLTINDPYFSALVKLSKTEADIFFFSVYIWNSTLVLRLINDLAKALPSSRFILGGPQVAIFTPSELPPHTTCVTGEVEGLPADFYNDLKNRALKKHYQALKTDSFPSPYQGDDFNQHLRNRHIYYESSRGCPYSCSYCLSSTETGVRYKDMKQVKEELLFILNNRPTTLRFIDRTYNSSPDRALEIWKFLKKNSLHTTFHFEISPDIFSEEMFAFLETVPNGLFQFEIGIQSTNSQTLAAINRKTELERTKENIKRLVQLGTIHLHVDLILGLPHETMASFEKSFTDVFSLQAHYIQMGLLKVLPNTPVSKQVDDFSLAHCALPPYEILSTKWMNHKELSTLYLFGECVEAFYNNRFFKSFFKYIQNSGRNGFHFFMELVTFCNRENFFERAKNQRFMSQLLYSFSKQLVPHSSILQELLVFDWLHSGNRFLPNHLSSLQTAPKDERNRLWHSLPQDLPPFYSSKTRNHFFKQSFFLSFSREVLAELEFDPGEKNRGTLCFLIDKESSVMDYCKVLLVPEN